VEDETPVKSISRTYPTPELRFYRRANGKAILQQRWCTEAVTEMSPEEERRQLIFVGQRAPEYFWQDVPMVTE
jgi:hypothetical protein